MARRTTQADRGATLTQDHLLAYMCRGDALFCMQVYCTLAEIMLRWNGTLRRQGEVSPTRFYFSGHVATTPAGFDLHVDCQPTFALRSTRD